ncbi:MAG: diguanylate cyclase [Allopontixanthobacter sediminis]
MGRDLLFRALVWFIALIGAGIALPAAAMPTVSGASVQRAACSVSGPANISLARLTASRPVWNCAAGNFDLSQERTVLRMEIGREPGTVAENLPRFLIGRSATFKRIEILAEDRDGSMRTRGYSIGEVQPGLPGLRYSAALPAITGHTRFVYIAVEGAGQQIVFDQLELADELPGNASRERGLLLFLAVLCGMIMMPLAFNLAFYRILREPFLLWHLALSICALAQIVLTAGFYTWFVDLSMQQLRAGVVVSLGGMIVSAAMFAAHFIEPGKLSPAMRRALMFGALWAGFITLVHASAIESLGRYSSDLFYFGSAMMLPLFAMVMWSAIRSGSRAIWFQLIGWTPLFLAGSARVISYFVPELTQTDANGLFHFGIALECVATALGVADRFMIVRRQRDQAISKARLSEALSECDPLTGLMNRRGIEPRFAELRELGFHTFALIDLDRFKLVNDTYGHAVGDAVLQAVAQALEPDENVLAMRLGGEEFVLLLRGSDTHRMAEQRRMAIPTRTASEVPGLDRLVTASMGLIEMPLEGLEATSFNELYVRADELLYQAKEAGRNRAVFEKLIGFPDRRGERRPGKQVAA